jgi:hypothetical protein
VWVPAPGRNADIYVLALHDVVDDTADHRDPDQWAFFVATAHALPAQKTIGMAVVRELAPAVRLSGLATAVERHATLLVGRG